MKKLSGRVAVQAQSDLDEPELPKISSKKIPKIKDYLSNLKTSFGEKLLTPEQITTLSELTFSDGETVLSTKHLWFVYEVSWILQQLGYPATLEYLSKDWLEQLGSYNLRNKILFESPLLEQNKLKLRKDMAIYQNQVSAEKGEPCKRCGSENTVSVSKQTRSADEAETIKILCGSCGYRWTAQ